SANCFLLSQDLFFSSSLFSSLPRDAVHVFNRLPAFSRQRVPGCSTSRFASGVREQYVEVRRRLRRLTGESTSGRTCTTPGGLASILWLTIPGGTSGDFKIVVSDTVGYQPPVHLVAAHIQVSPPHQIRGELRDICDMDATNSGQRGLGRVAPLPVLAE